MSDRITKSLAYAALLMVLLILTLAFYIVWTGLLKPQAPRTYIERELQRLEATVETKPQVPEGWRDYIRTLIAAGQFSKAHRAVEEGRSMLTSESAVVDIEEARLIYAEGNPGEALEALEVAIAKQVEIVDRKLAELKSRGIDVDPTYVRGGELVVEAYVLKAQILSSQQRWEEAAEAYTSALELSPAMADVLTARGFVYLELGEERKAKKDFEKALTFDPELGSAKTGLEEIE